MYHARIESHDLRRISTDPQLLVTVKAETLQQCTEGVCSAICMEEVRLLNGYAITVTYSRIQEERNETR
jgi:hypothetical protein